MENRTKSLVIARRTFLSGLAASFAAAGVSGCGTILYPDRIGQPCGPLDWKVVALDTIGLLFFLVPGIIAFIVDFHNGTIYLPPDRYSCTRIPAQINHSVPLPPGDITLGTIAKKVKEELDVSVELSEGSYLTRELKSLEDYGDVSRQLAMDLDRGVVSVRCQSPQ